MTYWPECISRLTLDQMGIDFVAYSADCRVWGEVSFGDERLTDFLNGDDPITLKNAVLEALVDGRVVEMPAVNVEREELFVVEARGPRGNRRQRIHTMSQRLDFQLGPYRVLGELHGRPGTVPLANIRNRGAMIPLTNSTIAYQANGRLRVHDAGTLIINWTVAEQVEEAEVERWTAKDYTWALG